MVFSSSGVSGSTGTVVALWGRRRRLQVRVRSFARVKEEFCSWWVVVTLTVPRVACGTVLEALKVGGDCEWSPLVFGQGDGANRVARAAVREVDDDLLGGGGANEEQHEAAKTHLIGLGALRAARLLQARHGMRQGV